MIPPPSTATLLDAAARRIDRRDAEILLAHAWQRTRTRLLVEPGEPVPEAVQERVEALVTRRAAGEPVAYLLGRREFWGLSLEVGPAVLVPRPETELLVERALANLTAVNVRIGDLGTGSGAIAIALAHERPRWRVCATDVSADALVIARRNGDALVNGRVEWLQGDWYAPLCGRRFDALVSNPPYIAADDPALGGDGLRHEPRGALTPGGDGLQALSTIVQGAPEHLLPGGWLALEHGAGQGDAVRRLLVARGFTSVTSHRDLAGHERVTEGKLAA
jgi:release factor glutamine methyltransferase